MRRVIALVGVMLALAAVGAGFYDGPDGGSTIIAGMYDGPDGWTWDNFTN